MEPWDRPALVTFSDGGFVGVILDRNSLRLSYYRIVISIIFRTFVKCLLNKLIRKVFLHSALSGISNPFEEWVETFQVLRDYGEHHGDGQ